MPWPYVQLIGGLLAVVVVTWLVVRRFSDGALLSGAESSRPDRSQVRSGRRMSRDSSTSAGTADTSEEGGTPPARVIW